MGGAVFLLLAAAEMKRREDASRRAARRRREEEERRNRERKSRYGSSESSKPRYSFEDHLRKVILENSAYLDYVTKIYEEGFEIDKQDQKGLEDQIDSMIPAFAEAEKLVEEKRRKVEESGIEVSSNPSYIGSMRFATDESYRPIEVGNHKFVRSGYDISFNGIKINKTILDDDGKVYQEQYDSHVATYPNIEEELNSLRNTLRRQESIQRFPLMNTYKRQQRIAELKKDIATHERDLETRQKREKELEAYKSLTPEQKGLIREYLDAIDKSLEVMKPIELIVCKHIGIKKRYITQEIDRRRWERAEENVLSSGKATAEEAKAFNDMMTEEIREAKSSYPEGVTKYQIQAGEVLGRSGPLEWLIKVRAIEFAREEKTRLKEEEKTLDEAMALTEQRDKIVGPTGVTTTALEDKEKSDKEKEEAKEAVDAEPEDKKTPEAEEQQRKDAAEYAGKEEKEDSRDEQ